MFSKLFPKKSPKPFTVKNNSPMDFGQRFLYALLIILGLFSFLRYAFWWFKPEHIPSNWITQKYAYLQFMDYTLFAVLSIVVFFGLILKIGTWFTTWFMKRPKHVVPAKGMKVAFVTCYVPGNEPLEMLKETLIAMRNADYSHHTWVLDEGNTEEVKNLADELGIYYFTRSGKDHYNASVGPFRKKTKAGNLNSWRNEYEGLYDVVAQVDMDHVPHKNYLTKLLGFFKDESVGFVGVPQIYKNTDSWIAKGASEQTHFYYGPLQQGFYGAHMPFLIGTTHVYRVKALAGFGGYAPTIAEDYLTGLHFFSNGWKGVYVPEILAEGLGPVTWVDYFNQQMRWSYGLFEILFKHTKNHFPKLSLQQKINLIFSQLFYFSGFTSFLGFILTFLYLVLGINSTNMTLIEWASYSIPAYLSGLFIMMFLHKYYIDPKSEPMIGWRGVFLGQAASIIYTISFIKFFTRQKLTYKVTPKDSDTSVVELSAFSVHILLLLYSVLGLIISFILENNSLVMRFWAFLNIFFLTGMLVTAYWSNSINKLAKFLMSFTLISKNQQSIKKAYQYKAPVLAFASLLLTILMIYSIKSSDHPVLSSTKEMFLSQINNQAEPLITPGKTIESSNSAVPRIYTETASQGESAPILYRRMVVKYAQDYKLYLDSGKKGNIVNFLTESKPVKLKTGDKITLTSDDLWEVFSKI